MSNIAEITLDRKSHQRYDYQVPDWLIGNLVVGMRVRISFRHKEVKGTVVALKESSSISNLLPILGLITTTSALSDAQWKLAHWISRYYATPLDKVLRLFIPAPLRTVNGERKRTTDALLLEAEFFRGSPKRLNEEQKCCLDAILSSLREGKFATHLIHGVTGSGKTEIYLQAIEEARTLGKGALFLIPEVSLTSQTIERIRSRFAEPIAVLHHRRSLGERNNAWQKLASGEISIAIGARSALFAPICNLGLIIVDEEHDASYKQSDETPCYHARNVAVMRAHLESATILLGSATPSIESRYNAEIGKYRLHSLTQRATSASLPPIHIIDMKEVREHNGGFTHFSDPLLQAIERTVKKGEQTLLFLNRRGYHRLQTCAECRTTVQCPHCDLALTFHREPNQLSCHLCGFDRDPPRNCPSCGASDTLQFKGFGTEHVERSLHAVLPDIRTLRMDRDTTKKKMSHEELFKQFRSHKADVLIGTQMIAKGFHFPSVTLVGILNADAPLHIPDFRSSELLFQLVTQVAGRSGRADLPGEVILQTFLPNHPVIQLASKQDYNSFFQKELEERRLFHYPPFTHLIKCLFSSEKGERAHAAAVTAYETVNILAKHLTPAIQIFPPSAAGHAKIKDLYRFQFLIKAWKRNAIEQIMPHLSALTFKETFVKIDVDPLSLF